MALAFKPILSQEFEARAYGPYLAYQTLTPNALADPNHGHPSWLETRMAHPPPPIRSQNPMWGDFISPNFAFIPLLKFLYLHFEMYSYIKCIICINPMET